MTIRTVATTPFHDQKPGTSGLRKKVTCSRQRIIWKTSSSPFSTPLPHPAGSTLVLGGDGRYYNREAIQIILQNGRGQRLRQGAGGAGRHSLHAGGLLRDPQIPDLRRHHPVGQPQPGRPGRRFRHQVQHRQRRPGAGEDHRRDFCAQQDAANSYRIVDAPDVALDQLGSSASAP